jgi:hypothetical protein
VIVKTDTNGEWRHVSCALHFVPQGNSTVPRCKECCLLRNDAVRKLRVANKRRAEEPTNNQIKHTDPLRLVCARGVGRPRPCSYKPHSHSLSSERLSVRSRR